MIRRFPGGLVVAMAVASLVATACASGGLTQGDQTAQAGDETVIVGSTNFTEQLILAHMYADVLEDRGVKVETRLNLGKREVVFPALKAREVSVVPEYTGALLSYLTDGAATASEPGKVTAALNEELPDGIVALEPAPAQNKDALAVTRETAKEYDLQAVSDLEGVADELIIGGPPELETRALGLPGYEKVYGFEFDEFRSLDAGGPLTKSALKQGDIDVARLFTTDPAIERNDWIILRDDKGLVPAQNLLPVMRQGAQNPTVRNALNELSSKLTTETMLELNGKVDLDKQDPAKVARQWLQKEGLIGS